MKTSRTILPEREFMTKNEIEVSWGAVERDMLEPAAVAYMSRQTMSCLWYSGGNTSVDIEVVARLQTRTCSGSSLLY